jgi:zinc-binding alcohol dehydrogenase/oxidoreductase
LKVGILKAVVLASDLTESALEWTDWPDPVSGPGWVTVKDLAAGLNRNDAMNVDGRELRPGRSVIGADGAGVIAEIGDGVEGLVVGDNVVVLPSLWWGDIEAYPGPSFEILGDTTAGTLAEYVSVPAENVYRCPERLSWSHAAAMPLAGVTAWRALMTQGGLSQGQRLLVTGASGGVATFAIQIAGAIGAEVHVTTSSSAKLDDAISMGARAGVVREPGWESALLDLGPFDVVLDSAGANWPQLLKALAPGGTLVSIGRTTREHAEIPIHELFLGQRRILGSTMGSPRQFGALLDHITESSWVPLIDSTFALSAPDDAFARLNHRDRVGKVVLETATQPSHTI